jgi:hypothetical protein
MHTNERQAQTAFRVRLPDFSNVYQLGPGGGVPDIPRTSGIVAATSARGDPRIDEDGVKDSV